MRTFRATIHVTKLEGQDSTAARGDLEEALLRVGFGQWRIVAFEDEQAVATAPPRRAASQAAMRRRAPNPGLWLLTGAVIWALWFFWSLVGED